MNYIDPSTSWWNAEPIKEGQITLIGGPFDGRHVDKPGAPNFLIPFFEYGANEALYVQHDKIWRFKTLRSRRKDSNVLDVPSHYDHFAQTYEAAQLDYQRTAQAATERRDKARAEYAAKYPDWLEAELERERNKIIHCLVQDGIEPALAQKAADKLAPMTREERYAAIADLFCGGTGTKPGSVPVEGESPLAAARRALDIEEAINKAQDSRFGPSEEKPPVSFTDQNKKINFREFL